MGWHRLFPWKTISGAMLALLAVGLLAYGPLVYEPVPEIPAAVQAELSSYLESHWQSPRDYVLGKFVHHDVVFLGELHRVRHDVEFVQRLIPALHEAGVFNLCIEFGSSDLQSVADSLLLADSYSPAAARKLMFDYDVTWGYKEYLELYRAAWELNQSLDAEERPFRIIHLGYSPDFTLLQDNMTDELRSKVWYKGDRDRHMAEVIEREILVTGEKALVYCGRNHAFTKFHQPFYDMSTTQVAWRNKYRLGNLVYNRIGDRTCTILLHSPWYGIDEKSAYYPVGGAIDRVLLDRGNRPVGFDTQETPFGTLGDDRCSYGLGDARFDLATICDGYVFLKPLVDFEGCTVDPEFITAQNFDKAIDRFPTLIGRKILRNPWLLEQSMKWDANMKHHFRNLTG